MSYEDIARLNLVQSEISDAEVAEADAEKAYESVIAEMEALKERLSAARSARDNHKERAKNARKKQEELKKEAEQLTLRIKASEVVKVAADREKLDNKAKRFKWDASIYDVQREDAYRIAQTRRILLGNSMGTGKTITSLAAADMANVRNLLILCPTKLAGNFEAEIKRWAPQRFVLNLASENKHVKAANFMIMEAMHQHKKPTALILNYEGWVSDFEGVVSELIKLQFDGIIMDEAHNFKNKDTIAFRGIKKIVGAYNTCLAIDEETGKRCRGYLEQTFLSCTKCGADNSADALSADDQKKLKSMTKLVLPMTGTFLMNSPQDIWPALNLILPETFDSERTFLEVFAKQDFDGKWIFKDGGTDSLAIQLGPRYIRRTMEDMGITLPEQHVETVTVPLSDYPEQRKVIDDLRKHAAVELGDGNTMPIAAIIALITRQRQAATYPDGIKFDIKDPAGEVIETIKIDCKESAKIDYLMDNVTKDVLFDGKKVAIFSQFSSAFPEIKKRLESLGLKVAVCSGETSKAEMETIKTDFTRGLSKNKYQVVIANFRVGGAGLNFTDVTQTYELDAPWNDAMRAQAQARTRRIGQTEETNYTILNAAGTIDTWMQSLVDYKKAMVNGFNQSADKAGAEYAEMLKSALTGNEITDGKSSDA